MGEKGDKRTIFNLSKEKLTYSLENDLGEVETS